MRFLVDECTGPAVAEWLKNLGHETFSVYDEARGMTDDAIIDKAYKENWILVTIDKDFGEKVFRDHHPHKGVVFLRLENQRTAKKIDIMEKLLQTYADQLPDRFVVVTETQVRFAKN